MPHQICTSEPKVSWLKWHRQLGHIGIDKLKEIHNCNLVDGFEVDTSSANFDCKACIQAKQAHMPFPKTVIDRADKPRELTHTDVWGLARTESLDGTKYYISFINNCTCKCTVKFMKTKDETNTKVQQYLAKVKTQLGVQPKQIHTDNGAEYVNTVLTNWCQDCGIVLW